MQRLAYIICLLRPDFVDEHPCGKHVRGLAFYHELKAITVSEARVGSPVLVLTHSRRKGSHGKRTK